MVFVIFQFSVFLFYFLSLGANGSGGDPTRWCCLRMHELLFFLTSSNIAVARRARRNGNLPVGGLGVIVLCEGSYVCRAAVTTGRGEGGQ